MNTEFKMCLQQKSCHAAGKVQKSVQKSMQKSNRKAAAEAGKLQKSMLDAPKLKGDARRTKAFRKGAEKHAEKLSCCRKGAEKHAEKQQKSCCSCRSRKAAAEAEKKQQLQKQKTSAEAEKLQKSMQDAPKLKSDAVRRTHLERKLQNVVLPEPN